MNSCSRPHSSFTTLQEFTKDVLKILSDEDKDSQLLQEVGDKLERIINFTEEQQDLIKKDLKSLIDIKTDQEHKISATETELLESELKLNLVKKEISKVEEQKIMAEKECKCVKESLAKKQDEIEQFEEKKNDMEKQSTTNILKIKHDVNLYSRISGIRWQYDCQPEEVKGYICLKSDVKPFSLNSQKNSQFFIINYLWDLMDTSW